MNSYFLKLDGIRGDSKQSKHKGELEIESWSFGEDSRGSFGYGGGEGDSKVASECIHFTKLPDSSSELLLLACAQGKQIEKAVLTCERYDGGELRSFFAFTFKGVMVNSFQTSGSNKETFSLVWKEMIKMFT